jgi:hypothetical protein
MIDHQIYEETILIDEAAFIALAGLPNYYIVLIASLVPAIRCKAT